MLAILPRELRPPPPPTPHPVGCCCPFFLSSSWSAAWSWPVQECVYGGEMRAWLSGPEKFNDEQKGLRTTPCERPAFLDKTPPGTFTRSSSTAITCTGRCGGETGEGEQGVCIRRAAVARQRQRRRIRFAAASTTEHLPTAPNPTHPHKHRPL